MANILEIKNLSFRYNTSYVFNKLNLCIKKNDFVYLIGTNNSGKTTLINILKSYPYDGEIYINGLELSGKYKEEICKAVKIIDRKYVKECKLDNIIDKIKELSGEDYDNYLKDYQLLEIKNKMYNKLCLLDKIKTLLFINMIDKSEFLIIDEILDMLDSKDKNIMYKLLKKYQKKCKKTILIVSNNADGIVYARRIIVLNKGTFLFDGTIKDIENSDNVFNELSIKLPFIIDLSIKLKLYNLIDKIYIDEKRMIKDIWKK